MQPGTVEILINGASSPEVSSLDETTSVYFQCQAGLGCLCGQRANMRLVALNSQFLDHNHWDGMGLE